MKSLWTPAVRWTEVTEEGFRGGPVMPDNYNGSPQTVEQLSSNIARSGIVGSLVGQRLQVEHDLRAAARQGPGHRASGIDYRVLSHDARRQDPRARSKPDPARSTVSRVHVIGFAKLVGDLIDGLVKVVMYFGIAALIATLIIFGYHALRAQHRAGDRVLAGRRGLAARACCRSAASSSTRISILVPFLVFAIGVSHGAQKMNGIMQDIGRGTHRLVAARYTFRRLFLAGADRAARRRGRLRRADGHRHSRDPATWRSPPASAWRC